MLRRSLSEHSTGCFYGSEQLASLLWTFLCTPHDGEEIHQWSVLKEAYYMRLVDSVDTRYPRYYRLNDIRQRVNKLCDEDLFTNRYLPELDNLYNRLMVRNGDQICYKETEIQAYARLAAELDPTLLVAWHISHWLQNNMHSTAADIRRIVAAQRPFFAVPGNPLLPFAEGHVHYGGITVDNAILSEYLLEEPISLLKGKGGESTWHQQQKSQLNTSLLRSRQLLTLLLENNIALGTIGEISHTHQREVAWSNRIEQLKNPLESKALPNWTLLIKTHIADEVGTPGWLLGEFSYAMHHQNHDRWLWLHIYLCCCYRHSDTLPRQRVAILCWLQTLNNIRRHLIMDGQGLTRFSQRYYRGPLGRGKVALKDNIRVLLPDRGDVAEIKATPESFTPDFVSQLVTLIAKQTGHSCPKPPYIFGEHEIIPDTNALNYMKTLERWQFCGHFSRTGISKDPRKVARADMQDLWNRTLKIMEKNHDTSAWNLPEFMMGQLNNSIHFQPSRWFRGLDVAGDENELHIEWFAPLLRWLRRGFISCSYSEKHSLGFHLSIHAGEDYAHPASGMRHIDETVQFCEMRDGDRLGHALALGIEPMWWVKQQREMILPVDEHLDNLVWLWHYSVLLSGKLALARQVQPLLVRRIMHFFPMTRWQHSPVFGEPCPLQTTVNSKGAPFPVPDPETLYKAWYLRRNCYYRLSQLNDVEPLLPLETEAIPDFKKMQLNTQVTELYINRHLHISAETEQPLVIIRSGDEWQAQECSLREENNSSANMTKFIEDIETPEELEFMHALQDYLLDRYDRLGLIIETNPTSNIYIARLEEHSQHPIFRWNPPDESVLAIGGKYNRFGLRRGPVRVLINTDDPGIMPTTLRSEFLLLREAAIDIGISRTVAECWLERLRQYGMEQFYRNHQPVFEHT